MWRFDSFARSGLGGRLPTAALSTLFGAWLVLAFLVRPALMAANAGSAIGPLGGVLENVSPMTLARLAAIAQWASFMGVLGLLGFAQWMRAGSPVKAVFSPQTPHRSSHLWSIMWAVAPAVAFVAFIWTPTTTLAVMAHDSFIVFDAIHRIQNGGQVPSLDFPSALGAATLYLPAIAASLTGTMAGSVELASAFVALCLGLAVALAGAGRLPAGVTAALILVVFAVAVPPLLLEKLPSWSDTIIGGEAHSIADEATYAMFYNRWGWAGLVALFAFLAPPPIGGLSQARRWLELVTFAAILGFLFFVKLSFFVIGCGAAVVYALVNPRPLRTLWQGGALTLFVTAGVGAASGILLPYLRDVLDVAAISGGVTGVLSVLRNNVAVLFLSLGPMLLLAVLERLTWRDWLVASFITVGSVLAILQNAQLVNIVSLIALPAYFIARVWRKDVRRQML